MADRVDLGSVVYKILFETGDTTQVSKQVGTAFDDIGKKASSMTSNMKNVKTGSKQVTSALTDIEKKADKTGLSFGKLKNSIVAGLGIGAGFSIVSSAVSGLKNALNASEQSYIEFENAMRRVNTITRLSESDLANLTDQVDELSKVSGTPVQELASGLYDVASAGVEAGNQMAFLEVANKAAIADFGSINDQIAGLTAVIKGYGLAFSDAQMVSDKFFKTNELGQTTVGQVANSIQKVTASAETSGLALDELFTIFATFTGVTGNAAEVSTQLRGALNALVRPTERVRAKIDEYNKTHKDNQVVLGDSVFATQNFADVSKALIDSVGGSQEELRKLIPEVEAMNLILAAGGTQFDTYNSKLEQMGESSGSAEKAYSEAMKSIENRNKVAKANFESLGRELAKPWANFKLLISEFALEMVKSVKLIINLVKAVANMFLRPLSLLISSAILLFIGFVKDVQSNWSQLGEVFSSLWKVIKSTFAVVGGVLVDAAKTFVNFVKRVGQIINQFFDIFKAIGTFIKDVFKNAFSAAVDTVVGWAKSIFNVFKKVKDAVVGVGEAVWTALKGDLAGAKNVVIGLFDGVENEAETAGQNSGDSFADGFANSFKNFSNNIDSIIGQDPVKILSTENVKLATEDFANSFSELKNAAKDLNFNNTKKAVSQIGKVIDQTAKNIKKDWGAVASVFNENTRAKSMYNFTKAVKQEKEALDEAIKKEKERQDQLAKQEGQQKANKELSDQLRLMSKLGKEIDDNIDIYARIEDSYQSIEEKARRATDVQKSKWEEMFDVLSDGTLKIEEVDKVYATALKDIASSLDDLENKHKKINDSIDEMINQTEEYQDVASDNETVLTSYEEIEGAVNKAIDSVKKLKDEIEDINQKIAKGTQDYKDKIAENVVEAEQKIKELRDELSRSEDTGDRANIQQQIAEQEELINSAKKLNIDYQAELDEARRKASLNAIELLADQYEAEQAKLEEQKLAKEQQLQSELDLLQSIKDQENLIYETQRTNILAIESKITTAYRENMQSRLSATQEFVEAAIVLYNRLAEAAKNARSAGANLSTEAVGAISKYQGFDIQDQESPKQQTINNITQNINFDANINSDLDIQDVVDRISLLTKEQISQ